MFNSHVRPTVSLQSGFFGRQVLLEKAILGVNALVSEGLQGLGSSNGWWKFVPLAEGPWKERVFMCRSMRSNLMEFTASGPAI